MATKLIENVDDEIWRKFAGYCKIKNVVMGEKLNEILKNFLKNRNIK